MIYKKVPDFYISSLAEKENHPIKKKQKKSRETQPLDLSAMTELFMCNKCTKSYRLRHSLTRHLKFECGKEPTYACLLCDRKFKHKYDLNVHEKGKHGLNNKHESHEDGNSQTGFKKVQERRASSFSVIDNGNADRKKITNILGVKN